MESDITPFKGRTATIVRPTRLLKRFAKSGHVAEIRERMVTSVKGSELIVLVDGSLLESEMFHGSRLKEYAGAVEIRARRLVEEGWQEESLEA